MLGCLGEHAVVVTGLGVVAPSGVGVPQFWRDMCAGRVCTAPVAEFQSGACSSPLGGQVRELAPAPPDARLPRSTQLAELAAAEAWASARLCRSDVVPSRASVFIGSVLANRPNLERWLEALWSGGPPASGRLPPPPFRADDIPRRLARKYAFEAGAVTVGTACAAGNNALAQAAESIACGEIDLALAGGADELSMAMQWLFSRYGSLAAEKVQPFDLNRTGLVLGEGAAILVLESRRHAEARNASILAQFVGYGCFSDAHDMTHPHPRGEGAIASMRAALEMAGLEPSAIEYVSAHGTGTKLNDSIEVAALRSVFGAALDRVPVSSIKSMLGHCQGAASAIEAVSCVLAIRDGLVPPTANYSTQDPDCDIDVVPNRARRARVRAAMNNAFGFGGNVSCTIFAASA
jgi:3-oxoacyl-(acyl-carrier-protein) synthase